MYDISGQDIKFQPISRLTTDMRVESLLSAVLLATSDHDLQYTLRQFVAQYDKTVMKLNTSNSKFMILSLSLNKR